MSFTLLGRLVDRMVAFSVGILLGAALLHLLPEAVESGIDPHRLFALLLAGLLGLFLLERFAIVRHSHHHEGDAHVHEHGFDARQAGRGGLPILVGDSIHNFCDGVVIAAAFAASPERVLVATAAIVAHEVPSEVGDFMVLLNAGFSRRRAVIWNLLCSLAGVLGGVAGWWLLESVARLVPYALVLASSSFIYIALSDLIPQLHREGRRSESVLQIVLIAAGVLLIGGVFMLLGEHA
ncbi:ZIP family metal transporter [soil metagenome]